MAVKIYRITSPGQPSGQVAWLCGDEWTLPPQLEALAHWLKTSTAELPRDRYVADIGFQWRREAGGGGSLLDPTSMQRMTELGMTLLLSEYPGFAGEDIETDPTAAGEGNGSQRTA